jgi:delta8-fatty-acid desaturase
MSNFRVFTPREVEARIAAGDALVIFRGSVLRLNNWQGVHPGGYLVIQHQIGRDATDELSM